MPKNETESVSKNHTRLEGCGGAPISESARLDFLAMTSPGSAGFQPACPELKTSSAQLAGRMPALPGSLPPCAIRESWMSFLTSVKMAAKSVFIRVHPWLKCLFFAPFSRQNPCLSTCTCAVYKFRCINMRKMENIVDMAADFCLSEWRSR